jgi:hypothetical protein
MLLYRNDCTLLYHEQLVVLIYSAIDLLKKIINL